VIASLELLANFQKLLSTPYTFTLLTRFDLSGVFNVPGTFKAAVEMLFDIDRFIFEAKSAVKNRSPAMSADLTEPTLWLAEFLSVCSTESPTNSEPVRIDDARVTPKQRHIEIFQ